MSGLLRRLTRRRAATADETRPQTPAGSEPVEAPAPAPAEGSGEQPVPESEQPTAAHDLPAGVDPGELGATAGEGARRGGVRRRARYLRAVREVLLRDLGGFTYEVHRTAGGSPEDSHRRLIEAKAARLAAIDTELRALEDRLGEPRPGAVLRQPGLGGTCPECGELHGSEAAFCWRCGLALSGRPAHGAAPAATAPRTAGHIAAPAEPGGETAARLALWMKTGKAPGGEPAEPAGDEPAKPAPAEGEAAAPAAKPKAKPAKPKPMPAKPAKPAKADPVPADQQPTAVERPSDDPGSLSEGDPLATPAERGS